MYDDPSIFIATGLMKGYWLILRSSKRQMPGDTYGMGFDVLKMQCNVNYNAKTWNVEIANTELKLFLAEKKGV